MDSFGNLYDRKVVSHRTLRIGGQKKKMRETRKTIRSQEIAVAMGLAMILGITGCADKEAKTQENAQKQTTDTESEDSAEGEDRADASKVQPDETDGMADAKEGENDTDASELTESGAEASEGQADSAQAVKVSEETEHLGGKIWKLQEDGMTFAHTSLVEDNEVTILDVEDAEKIQVKYTTETEVEHWIIQGGGAGIDMQEAAFSDLKEGMGVELEGYFDGETFVATKVIMEDYV